MPEFTGERLIPGQIDADLWNEHISRYAFAASLCSGSEQVLDAGCGTGYGSSFLSHAAKSVFGIDASHDAIAYANRQYASGKARFAIGLCEALPLGERSVDRIIAFEVIEHLAGWRTFLEECGRVLRPGGLLVVSTPNEKQYNESRGAAGPNPYHVHEFQYPEFVDELERAFPFVRMYGQMHGEAIVFAGAGNTKSSARFARLDFQPEEAGFFVAICSGAPLDALPNFVYVPESANVLREREEHIRLLREELELKDRELEGVNGRHAALVQTHRGLKAELERNNMWAVSLNRELDKCGERVRELQTELETSQRWAAALNGELAIRSDRVVELQQELTEDQSKARTVIDALHADLKERAEWALGLDAELERARQIIEQRSDSANRAWAALAQLRGSPWGKTGRALHLVRFPQ